MLQNFFPIWILKDAFHMSVYCILSGAIVKSIIKYIAIKTLAWQASIFFHNKGLYMRNNPTYKTIFV